MPGDNFIYGEINESSIDGSLKVLRFVDVGE